MKAIRCAKWCGRGCTEEEYRRAVAGAARLVKRLGPGWRARVWENLGWHYCAVSRDGFWKLHGHGDGWFTAFLGECESGGRWAESARSPALAIRKVIGRFAAEVAMLDRLARSLYRMRERMD